MQEYRIFDPDVTFTDDHEDKWIETDGVPVLAIGVRQAIQKYLAERDMKGRRFSYRKASVGAAAFSSIGAGRCGPVHYEVKSPGGHWYFVTLAS